MEEQENIGLIYTLLGLSQDRDNDLITGFTLREEIVNENEEDDSSLWAEKQHHHGYHVFSGGAMI